jgi:hypothetical protein
LTRGIKAKRHKGNGHKARARCMDFKKACDTVMKHFLYNKLIQFGIPMKLVRLINMGSETGRCCIATAFQLCLGWTLQILVYADDVYWAKT